jgi:hypothetical protein
LLIPAQSPKERRMLEYSIEESPVSLAGIAGFPFDATQVSLLPRRLGNNARVAPISRA